MNCQAVQSKILAVPDPRMLPEPLRGHVAGCAACRDWANRAARLESLLEQLPVPAAPGDKKAALLDELTRDEPVISRPLAVPAHPNRAAHLLTYLRQNAAVVGGLAAAVLVVLGGWWLFTRPGTSHPELAAVTPKHPFLEKLVQRDVALAKADTQAKRLQVLGGLADDLSTETRGLARVASPDELRDLARWFDKVVKDGVVKQAEKMRSEHLTPGERKERETQFDGLANKLGDAAREAEKVVGEVPVEAKPALQKIVDAARDGETKLRLLAKAGS